MARNQKNSNQGWNVQQMPAAPAKHSKHSVPADDSTAVPAHGALHGADHGRTHNLAAAPIGNGYYIKIALAIAVVLVGLAINLNLPSSSELGSFSTSSSRIVVALATVGVALKGYNVLFLLAIPALYVFFNYVKQKCDVTKRMRVVSIVIAFLFAVFMVVGYSFVKENGFDLVNASLGQVLKSLLALAGYWVLFAYAIEWLYCWLGVKRHLTVSKHVGKVMHFVFDKAPFWIPFAIICIFWLPRLILYYPGLFMGDTHDQINWICAWFKTGDISSLHNNDPLIHTLLIAFCIKIGMVVFASENVGYFLYTLIQFFLSAAVLAYGLKRLTNRKVPHWIRMVFLIFFCMTTFFINYAVLGTKDVMFASFVLLYLIYFADMVDGTDGGFRNRKKVALLAVWAVLLCLFRFNGLIVVVLSLPFLLFKSRSSWKAVVGVFAAIIVLGGGFSLVLQPALGITAGYTGRNAPAGLTIPLQQTARYVKNYSYEVTPEEKAAISGVLNYDKIATVYNPLRVDPISAIYKVDIPAADQSAYMNAWREMFFKHPLVYAAATVNNYYGYVYFGTKYPGCYNFDTSKYSSKYRREQVNNDCQGYFNFQTIDNGVFKKLVALLADYDAMFAVLPGISLTMSSALYFWIFLLGVGYCIVRRNKRAGVMYLAILGLFAAAFLGPANGIDYFRYIYPIAYCTPFVIGWHLSGDNLKR